MDTGEWMRQQENDLWREIVESFENGEITQMNEYTMSIMSDEHAKKIMAAFREDPTLHTVARPFCNDPDCICHSDESLFDEYINRPVLEGRLTVWDAQALLWPEQEVCSNLHHSDDCTCPACLPY